MEYDAYALHPHHVDHRHCRHCICHRRRCVEYGEWRSRNDGNDDDDCDDIGDDNDDDYNGDDDGGRR